MIKNSNKIISVVIVTYHSEQIIHECLSSLEHFNDIGEALEIIVVDNSPQDVAKKMFETIDYRYKHVVHKIWSGRNLGYGGGNNLGARNATGEILLFLNPDTRFIEPVFNNIIHHYNHNKNTATIGIQLVDEKYKKQISFFFVKSYISPILSLILKYSNNFSIPLPFTITSGACMFVRATIFEEVGGFSNEMFLYNEESYLAKNIKLLKRGYRNIYVSTSKIIHYSKSQSTSNELLYEYYKSLNYYYSYYDYNMNMVIMLHNMLFIIKSLYYRFTNKDKYHSHINKRRIFNEIFYKE